MKGKAVSDGEGSKSLHEKPKDATPSTKEAGNDSSIDSDSGTNYKTRNEFMTDLIVRYSGKKIHKDLSPIDRRKAIKAILNDPTVKHRFIFKTWPRPPLTLSPKTITPKNSRCGKMAPNGLQLWGATLFDFYEVQRMPELASLRTLSSGSMLLRWCEENGECVGDNAVAAHCIEWAKTERDPELVPVYDIEILIRGLEESAMSEATLPERDTKGPIMSVDESKEPDSEGQARDNSALNNCGDSVLSEVCEVDDSKGEASDENNSALPEIWKKVQPFCDTGPWRFHGLPVLEECIALSRLPRKLVVHDPWDVLSMRSTSNAISTEQSVSERMQEPANIMQTYDLQLSKKHTKRRKAEDKEILQKEKEHQKILEDFLANPHSLTKRPPGLELPYLGDTFALKSAIYVVFPPAPQLASPNEAHLYLNPNEMIGKGNHSTVYFAEWEVQRSFLVKEELCISCILDDVHAILREEDGENGERRDAKWEEPKGQIVFTRVTKPMVTMTAESPIPGEDSNTYILEQGERDSYLVYEGPYRVIQTRVGYQNLERAPYCQHLAKTKNAVHPLTAKVRVAAKLSIESDPHLANEAVNYQRFPKHFFEHWSGYNLVPPIHEPTPVGPLVPQFYGYYIPMENDEYLSPILLLEHCGAPIPGRSLSADDRNECVALCFRMHEANWLHGSIYQRNILRKPGPLSAAPDVRTKNSKKRKRYGENWSFRLIDFGRSGSGEAFNEAVDKEYMYLKGRYSTFLDEQLFS